MTNPKQRLRLYVRLACFLLATFLLLPFPFWIDSSRIFVQTSPFVTICTILAGGTLWVGSILGLVFSVVALVRKRWFCRYICPVGLILDTVSGTQFPARNWWKGLPPIGRYIVLLTMAGAVVGYPLFLWMDPLAFLNNAFSAYNATNVLPRLISLSGIVMLLFLALTSGNLWCARICPLGATQDLLEDIGSFCGRKIRTHSGKDSQAETAPEKVFPATRRMFITVFAGLGFSLLAQKIGLAKSKEAPLRPPGAIGESEFSGLCMRCGNCVRACPSNIIHPDTGQAGILGFLAPTIRFETDYCKEDCNACTKACPSGALQTLNLEQKHKYVIGLARVNRSLCLCNINECNECVYSCPFEAVKMSWDREADESYPAVDPLKCCGCGACEVYCPALGIKAIKVWKNTD